MRTYRVLYLITSTFLGGAEKILYETVKGMNNKEFNLFVCSLKRKGEFAQKIESEGVEVISLEATDKSVFHSMIESFKTLFRLINILRAKKVDILHCFLFRANLLGRIAGRLTGVPIIISSVRTPEVEKRYQLTLDRITSFMVDRYTAVSEAVREYSIEHGISQEKILTIYNGVSLNNGSPFINGLELKKIFGIKADESVIVTIGRLRVEKGHRFFLKSMVKVREKIPAIKALIVGKGKEEEKLKRYSQKLGLDDHVIFTGEREDISEIIQIVDVFVLPSLWEGMPNVLLEAMAAGKPVVATKVGGIPELVVHEETGILVHPEDSSALANAILDLLQDKLKAKKMGEAGRVRVEEHFNISRMVEKTENLYRELLREKQLL